MKKFSKKIIISAVICVVVLAILITSVVILLPDKNGNSDNNDNNDNESTRYENQASLNDNVTVLAEDAYAELQSSILLYEETSDGIRLTVTEDSLLSPMREGDVFVMTAEAGSVFGDVYFGKIANVDSKDGAYVYELQTPCIDEVLSDPSISSEAVLGYDNITDFYAVDGVSISEYGAEAARLGYSGGAMGNVNENYIVPLGITSSFTNNSVALTIEVDILKLLRDSGAVSSEADEKKEHEQIETEEEAELITVYYTDTGLCYHRETCQCLAKSKYPTMLNTAIFVKGLRPCKICKPPIAVYDAPQEDTEGDASTGENNFNSNISTSSELKLTGTVTLKDLGFKIEGKGGKTWKLNQGFDDLSVEISGDLIAQTTLSGNFSMDIEGESTQLVLWGDKDNPKIYLEGLNEKLLPLAFITYNGGSFGIRTGKNSADLSAPFTVGLMIYTDLQGNISASAEMFCTYTRSLDYDFDVFKNGKFVASKNKDISDTSVKDDFDYGLAAEVAAEADFQTLGASVMLYIGNMNVLELGLVTTGVEADGTLAFDSEKIEQGNSGLTVDAELAVYIEMLDLNFRFKYHSWEDALSADPAPLLRFELLRLEYQSSDTPVSGSQELVLEIRSDGIQNPDGTYLPDYYAVVGIGTYSGTELVIPSTYNGLSVRYIEEKAFENCTQLEKVTVSEGVKWIASYAFSGCTGLREIQLPYSLIYMEEGAFSGCTRLTAIELMTGIIGLDSLTFDGCTSLKSISIPNSIAYVEYGAVRGCASLQTVYYDGTASEWAEIEIAAGNEILSDADIVFLRDDGAQSWNYDQATKTLTISGTGDLPDYYIDGGEVPPWYDLMWADYDEDVIRHIVIKEGITKIGKESFMGYIESVTIPKSVNRIQYAAFSGELQTVYYEGTEAEWRAIDIQQSYNDDLLNANIIFLG